jgi:drug/metabolite transporter (DMT)-like permease
MPGLAIALWVANVVLDTAGRVAFKVAATHQGDGDRPRWSLMFQALPVWLGIACFALEFIAWLALLSLIPLSQAVLIGSINIVTVAIAGRIVFGERMIPLRLAGLALIAIGVALAGGLA